jgi:hypothetical protein
MLWIKPWSQHLQFYPAQGPSTEVFILLSCFTSKYDSSLNGRKWPVYKISKGIFTFLFPIEKVHMVGTQPFYFFKLSSWCMFQAFLKKSHQSLNNHWCVRNCAERVL